jgi:hypothetical protein
MAKKLLRKPLSYLPPGEHVEALGANRGKVVQDTPQLLLVRDGVGLESADHLGELDAIANKEHRHVVSDHVVVSLRRVELWTTRLSRLEEEKKNKKRVNDGESTLTAKPRGSRKKVGDPDPWITVENRTAAGVFFPFSENTSAKVNLLTSSLVTSK